MSKRCQFLLAATPAITLALTAAVLAAPPGSAPPEAARLATYDKASGSTHFALSLTPPAMAAASAHDIVVMVDTSASQTGVYRDDSLAALRSMLDSLSKNDRVKLVAVDMDAVALNDKFVAVDSPEMKAALEKLSARTPLGSTDMVKALNAAAGSFADGSADSRAVVYIGDGISKANLLGSQKFSEAVKALVKNRLPVTSFAIGPDRNLPALAALANQTGGNLYVDTEAQPSAQEFGTMLARATQTPVFFPTNVKLPAELGKTYPQTMPPLRGDRDSIVIGDLANPGNMKIAIQAEVAGKPVDLNWNVASEPSNVDFAFLPELVEMSKKDGGVSLPTVGSEGLREAGRVMIASADNLAKLGTAALASGDKAGAKTAAELAIQRDPENDRALALREVALQDAPAAEGAAEAPAPAPAAGVGDDLKLGGEAPAANTDRSLLNAFEQEGGLLSEENQRRKVQTDVIKTVVENALIEARSEMRGNPENVETKLKMELQNVEAAPELDPETRLQLRGKLEAAIREARSMSVIVSEQRAAAEERRAAANAQLRLLEATYRKQERVKQLMARFESLMDEQKYREAEEVVATEVRRLEDSPTVRVAKFHAQFVRSIDRMNAIFEKRQKGFFDVLALVEESHIPFPDEPPIVYPDAEMWEDITLKRKKYASIDLAKPGSSEQRIFEALDEPARNFEFFEAPLSEVVTRLRDDHEIPIVIDERALADASIGTDTLITKSLRGISLRSAMRLMLKDHGLSFVVRDEVLFITTQEEADTTLKTKVYPVADLVLPISSGNIANPFQLGGGLGGGGQGGFGGNQGGGFGGNQGGFGGNQGGGGFFAVEDELSLGSKATTSSSATAASAEKPEVVRPAVKPAAKVEALQVTIEKGQTAQQAWDAYFAKNPKVAGDAVRETVRQLMKAQKYDETNAVIQAALKSGHAQPWMYEALSLALQAAGTDSNELERTLMSAVDWARTSEDMMLVALHMERLGLDQRALQIFRDVSSVEPLRPEPYTRGLEIAKRLNDIDGIQWACVGILSQAWSKEQSSIPDQAKRTAQATLLQLHEEKRTAEAKNFEAALNQALVRDCLVRVTWTGDADIDLMIEEPSGSVCSFRAPRSLAGGVLVGDSVARQASTEGQSEVYVCPEAFSGQYRMLVKRVWGKVTSGKVTVDIYKHYNTDKQDHMRTQIPLGEKDALVVFDLDHGRRKEALAEHQVANVAKVQAAVGRAVLAQQIEAASSQNDALRDYAISQRLAQQQGRWFPGRRGGVGYRPQITTLPEGINMSATAVISADRRYVRITATPLFSSIAEVNTFNFATGAGTTTGGNTNNTNTNNTGVNNLNNN